MDFGVFLLALAMVYLLPGPDMLLLLHTGAAQGARRALVTALGLALARACHVALAGAGLALLFRTVPWTFDLVRLAGAAYLAWLGLRMLLARPPLPGTEQPAPAGSDGWRRAFGNGLLTNLLNPKALLFCSVLLPQFLRPDAGPLALQFAALGALLVLVGMAFDSFYALSGARLGRWLERHALARRVQQWTFATLLIGFGARLALLREV
ncbi:LysE family translocator [Pseudomonas citronellolis]|uniref:LysE family translocator n=1 Tax=Pseudomonas citronellolis TaxID=53408 RepID=UPI0023E45A3F|nr:LysE family translocator [Pseudomonas citronellolis]MDF3934915.1 LysE family translocator [Pseudomonas citronellolis]